MADSWLRDLESFTRRSFELVAVCDLRDGPARHVAGLAEAWLGRAPAVYGDARALLDDGAVDVLDVTTDAGAHHAVATPALERGVHVLVEKPLAWPRTTGATRSCVWSRRRWTVA